MELSNHIISLGGATIRMAAPLIFAALGGLCSERAGVVNIALEGKMLVGAFAAASITTLTHSPLLGFLGGGIAGMLLALVYALFVINFKANQIVIGIGVNVLAAGLIPFLSQILFQNTGSTPEIPRDQRFEYMPIIASGIIFVIIWAWLKYSPFGMWNKFAGEHPEALQTAGISVTKIRFTGILLAGFLAGLGGATLSICLSSNYTRNMSAGRGYMALAAVIIGSWRPVAAVLACLLFGFFDALSITLQSVEIEMPRISSQFLKDILDFFVSIQFIQMIPYILTIIVVAGFVGKSRPPKALGL